MAESTEELYSLLVPLHENRLIVPRACVAEVVRYVTPEGGDDSPSWFRGEIDWNNLRIPVVSFEELCGLEHAAPGGRTRIAVFHSVSGKLENGYVGIMTEGFPQLVRVNRDVLTLDDRHAWPADGPVICQVRMINEYPLIPDLEQLEAVVHEQLSATVP